MKKLLLVLMPVFIATGFVNAQLQGYSWYFASSPFNSVPAVSTSAGSYTLTEVGSGAPMVTGGTATVGLGTSCTGPVSVGAYSKPYGLQFSNSPQLVTNSYTIEIVANVTDFATSFARILGFSDNTGDTGVYITPGGTNITFFDGVANHDINMATPLTPATWYQYIIMRNGATKEIKVFVNGVQAVTTYIDVNDVFIPRAINSNLITFFKDNQDNLEESSGSVERLSVFNDTLSQIKVDSLFNNVCNTSFQFIAPNFAQQGYQWEFGTGTAPFASTGADAASSGSYLLTTLGSGSITPAPGTTVGIGTSCAGPISVGAYTKPFGLKLTNSPQYVAGTYSIELVLNVTDIASGPVRLVDFSGGTSNDGIYIDAGGGAILLIAGGVNTYVSPLVLTGATWYQFMFTRDSYTKDVRVYIGDAGGTIGQIGVPFNDAGDHLVPVESNAYNISFLKDDGTEESDGLIAKAAVFNKVLSAAQMQQRLDNICNANLIVLPVTLKNFNAQKVGKQVELTWTTSTEQNNLGFEVQRSANGSDYTAIGFVKGVGNSTTEVTYHFTDDAPLTGKGYYRLKQLNMDNRFKLSDVRLIDFARIIQGLQVYPNPSHSIITIVNVKAGNTLNIFDSFGRLVKSKKATDTQETLPVDQLSSGVYILQVVDGTGNKRTIRFTRL